VPVRGYEREAWNPDADRKRPSGRTVEMPEVPLTAHNATRCLCYACPVQIDSACATAKYAAVSASLGADGDMPPAADVPGMYCSSGLAVCDDLDFSGMCRCMGCDVYAEMGLDQWKYCQRGSAAQIG
jgi:hypothetical protein